MDQSLELEPDLLNGATLRKEEDEMQMMAYTILPARMLRADDEVGLRNHLADMHFHLYNTPQHGQLRDLRTAIEHRAAILRRLPPSSSERPKHLSSLSYMRMSEYEITKLESCIEQAVSSARDAKSEFEAAAARGVATIGTELHREILQNLGFAVLHRGGLEDMKSAIQYGHELLEVCKPGSLEYLQVQNNLASRLRNYYTRSQDPRAYDECLAILQGQVSRAEPGSQTHAMALTNLGHLISQKFRNSGAMDDLNRAIKYLEDGLADMPSPTTESMATALEELGVLYHDRYSKVGDQDDLRKLVHTTRLMVRSLPATHASLRGQYLLKHVNYLKVFAEASSNLADAEAAVRDATSFLAGTPTYDPNSYAIRYAFGGLLVRRYELSAKVDDFGAVVDQGVKITESHNANNAKDATLPLFDVGCMKSLRGTVCRLKAVSPQSRAGEAVRRAVSEYFQQSCVGANYPQRLLAMQREYGTRLSVWADKAESGQLPSEDDLEAALEKRDQDEARRLAKGKEARQMARRPRFFGNEYETVFGQRQLAVDPSTKKLIFELSGIFENVFGYEPLSQPVPVQQFRERGLRLERESVERERAEGKHPNPRLCHVCRRAKVLVPAAGNTFAWNPEPGPVFLLYGNWNQLICRSKCSICCLIVSLIADTLPDGTRRLHPRLAALDDELQGSALSLEEEDITSGGLMLRVEYGQRKVGHLCILSEQNKSRALRQARGGDDMSLSLALGGKWAFVFGQDEQKIPLHMLKGWLEDCHYYHGEICNGRQSGDRYASDIPLLLIDSTDECLVPSTSAIKYLALSYVWGKVSMSETVKANYKGRLRKGSLGAASTPGGMALPKTIQDAILVTKRLGVRYLWVDALCIVQDDAVNKHRHIQQMDLVYSKAFATIVAMSGTDANAGLPGVRPATREPQLVTSITVSNNSPDLEYTGEGGDINNTTIHMVASPTPVNLALDTAPWSARGWVLQEQLLSRRCLYFSSSCVYFQ